MTNKTTDSNLIFAYKKKYAMILTAILTVILLPLTACNSEIKTPPEQTEVVAIKDVKIKIPEAVKIHIEQYRQQYVEQMLRVQDRLLGDKLEVEKNNELTSKAINTSDADLENKTENELKTEQKNSLKDIPATLEMKKIAPIDADTIKVEEKQEIETATNNDLTTSKIEAEAEMKKQKQAERNILANNFKQSYTYAMENLFTEDALTTKQMNTFINMVTILPEALDNEEILVQLTTKSPALSRLINQHRVWTEIEEKQRLEVQKLQQERILDNEKREKELDNIATEFKDKIKKFDKKIDKYEKQVKDTR